MARLFIVVFLGKPRSPDAKSSDEAPFVMLVPLIILAVSSTVGGFSFFARQFVVVPHEREVTIFVPALAIGAMIVGLGSSFALYRNQTSELLDAELLRRRFYIDDFYDWLINSTQELLARIAAFIDRWIIDAGGVRGVTGGTWGSGALLRLLQVGNLQAYSFLFGLGIVFLIYFTVFR
jgi:NADH-quinone oxidoreductase subunit L